MTEHMKSNPLLLLSAQYSSLRDSEKKVAKYILEHPDDIIYSSISNLAEQCNVSETSVIRLCKAMGYNGFQDYKISIALANIEPTQQIHEEISDSDTTETIVNKIMTTNIRAIEDTMKIVSYDQIEKAIEAISNTKRLEFYGMGGSASVALDAQHKFFKYGFSCVAYSDTHMQAMSASTMGPGDVILAISHTGSSKDLIENLRIAHEAGATTICITGGMKSPITKVSDIVLMVIAKEQSYKPEPMSSRIAQLTLIDILSVGVAMRHQDTLLKNLQKTRKALSSKRF